jgi:hypothetical protein
VLRWSLGVFIDLVGGKCSAYKQEQAVRVVPVNCTCAIRLTAFDLRGLGCVWCAMAPRMVRLCAVRLKGVLCPRLERGGWMFGRCICLLRLPVVTRAVRVCCERCAGQLMRPFADRQSVICRLLLCGPAAQPDMSICDVLSLPDPFQL